MSSNLNQQLNQLSQMDQFKDMNQFMQNNQSPDDFVSIIHFNLSKIESEFRYSRSKLFIIWSLIPIRQRQKLSRFWSTRNARFDQHDGKFRHRSK